MFNGVWYVNRPYMDPFHFIPTVNVTTGIICGFTTIGRFVVGAIVVVVVGGGVVVVVVVVVGA